MHRSILLLIIIVYFCIECIVSINGAHTFDVYRLLQYDHNDQRLGSRGVVVNSLAKALSATAIGELSTSGDMGDLARSLLVLRIDDASIETLDILFEQSHISGLLLVLQRNIMSVDSESLDRFRRLERHLISREVAIPVYFAFEDDDLNKMLQFLFAGDDIEGNRYRLVVASSEANIVKTATAYNYQGWQHAAPASNSDAEVDRSIAIVANYDTFGGAPGLSNGVSDNGSGVVALLELARIFNRLYSEFRTQGSTSLLFILTGAGRFNYAGSKHWLQHTDSRILESLRFVLCMNSLLHSDDLYLHVSRPPKTEALRNLYDTFASTAAEMGVKYELIHKKVNISDPNIRWEHEQYSRKRVAAVTLSARRTPLVGALSGSLLDTLQPSHTATLVRNIKYVAEVLSRLIYSDSLSVVAKNVTRRTQESAVIADSYNVNTEFVRAWLDFLGNEPRVMPFVSKDDDVLSEIEEAIRTVTSEARRTSFPLDGSYKFYESAPTTMNAYLVKPMSFDMFLALTVAAYLGALFLYMRMDLIWSLCGRSKTD